MSYLMKCQAGQIYHQIYKIVSALSLNRQFYWPFLSEAEILQKYCRIFSQMGGISLAWRQKYLLGNITEILQKSKNI